MLFLKCKPSGAVLSLSLKTSSRSAVLAYNAGTANSNDFVAVEVAMKITMTIIITIIITMTQKMTITSSQKDSTTKSSEFIVADLSCPEDLLAILN